MPVNYTVLSQLKATMQLRISELVGGYDRVYLFTEYTVVLSFDSK